MQEYDWQNNHIRIGECVMITEQFLPINGYEGLYEISNLGNVKRLKKEPMQPKIRKDYMNTGSRERIMRPSLNGNGYLIVTLTNLDKRRRCYSIHRLVWEHFGSIKRQGNLQIDHIDNNKQNNHINNLRLLTKRENIIKAVMLTKKNDLPIGVSWDKKYNKYRSRICVDGKEIFIGYFDNVLEAKNAYDIKFHQYIF